MRKRIFKGFAAVLLSSTLTVSTVFAVFADDVDKLKAAEAADTTGIG